MPNILNAVQGIGIIFLIYGLWYLDLWSTFVGLIVAIESKLWYVERMGCLYEDMKDTLEYGKWEKISGKKTAK